MRAINISGSYPIKLSDNTKLSFSGNAYHLLRYESAASGDYALDGLRSDGRFDRPKWKVQARARLEVDKFFVATTWNHSSPTNIFSQGVIAGPEVFSLNRFPAVDLFDAAIGVEVNDKFRLQFSATNLTDVTFAGNLGYLDQDYVDQIGRRFQVTAVAKF